MKTRRQQTTRDLRHGAAIPRARTGASRAAAADTWTVRKCGLVYVLFCGGEKFATFHDRNKANAAKRHMNKTRFDTQAAAADRPAIPQAGLPAVAAARTPGSAGRPSPRHSPRRPHGTAVGAAAEERES